MRAPPCPQVSRRALLHAAAALGAGACGAGPTTTSGKVNAMEAPMTTFDRSTGSHARGARVTLLRGADITCAAVHPTEGYLATGSMTPRGEGEGQVVVWDATTGQPVNAHFDEHGFGFEPEEDMIAWAPVGHRIAVSSGTNAVSVIEDGTLVSTELPEETRDHPVSFCWLGDDSALFVAASPESGQPVGSAGAIMTIGQSGGLQWLPRGAPPRVLARMRYNAHLRAVVGDDFEHVFGVDVARGTLTYQAPLSAALPGRVVRPFAWSRGGQRAAVAAPVTGFTYDRGSGQNVGGTCVVTVLDGDSGRTLAQVPIDGEVDALRWSPTGDRLAIVAGPTSKDQRQVHVLDGARVTMTTQAAVARQAYPLPDARTVDWSPDADRLAVLKRDGSVDVVDVALGRAVGTFAAAPRADERSEAGLLWSHGDRIVVLSPRGVAFWSVDGRPIARHAV